VLEKVLPEVENKVTADMLLPRVIEAVSSFLDHSSLAVTSVYLRRLEGEADRTWPEVAVLAAAVDAKMTEINKTLPSDIRAKTVLNRTKLVDATIGTVDIAPNVVTPGQLNRR
jgi:hypothetical protein